MATEDPDYVFIDPVDAIQSDGDSIHAPQPPHIRTNIQKWLAPSEYAAESSDYNKHRRSYCPNTGEWLRTSDHYQHWHNSGQSALWINGIPGSGKSVVAASLINDLHHKEHVPVLYFFFRYANLANRTPKQMIRDWLSQLLDHSTLLQSRLKDLSEKSTSHESVTFADLSTIFTSAATALPKVYCVADALDEMEPGNDWFLHVLAEMGRQKPSTLKLLLTSRQSPHIEKVYKEPLVLPINLDRRLIDRDIATYIHHRLSGHPMIKSSGDHGEMIQSTVQTKSNGLFIYARLMMDEILVHATTTNIESLLQGLPSGMDDMYTTLLSEHSRRSGVASDIQILILQWITHATRPLRLLEVAELVRSVSQEYGSIQQTKSTVRSACGPLLTVLPDETLQVIHHSFTEFLVNTARTSGYPVFQAESVHTKAAVTAIDYVVSCSLAEKATGTTYNQKHCMLVFKSRERDAFFLKYPLLQYATNSWMVHASKSGNSDPLLIQAWDRFLAPSDDHFAFWSGIWHISGQMKVKNVPQPLHIVCFFGLKSFVVRSYGQKADVNVRDSGGRTPLSYACDGDHQEVVRLLLEHGASTAITSKFGVSTLHYACASNRPDIVKLLMDAGADPLGETQNPRNASGRVADKANYPEIASNRRRFGKSALKHVCTQGYIDCLQTMLEYLTPERRHTGPLHWAAGAGKADVVSLILKKYDSDPNFLDEKKNTALCLAAREHSPATVQLLLDSGASIHMSSTGIDKYYRVPDSTRYVRSKTDSNSMTPLHAWAYGCTSKGRGSSSEDMIKTAQILIGAGCDVNAKDTEGKTPLFYWTASSGATCSAFIDVLVSHGADAAIEDNLGCTPLHLIKYVSVRCHIQRLLNAGGSMNRHRSTDGRTPLMCALDGWGGSKPVDWSEYVTKYGVDPNAQDWDGKTALHYILSTESWDVANVQIWLQAGAEPNIADVNGQNCLFSMSTPYRLVEHEAKLFEVLAAAGCNINSTDHQGYNIALKLSGGDNFDKIKRLQQHGVDVSARTHQGRTALHLLAGQEDSNSSPTVKGRLELLKFFMEHGLDINAQDHSGDTMLHVALSNSSLNNPPIFVDTAVEVGADLAIRNHRGRTVVHSAAGAAVNRDRWHKAEEPALDLLLKPESSFDVDLADFDGRTPLHLAATRSASRVLKLVRAGSNISALDHQGRSVLHYAARAGNANILGQIIQILQAETAMELLDRKDCNGRTALHDAVRSGVLESVYILLGSNAEPKAKDNRGRTPLHIASEIKEEEMIRRLQYSTTIKPQVQKKLWCSDVAEPNYKSHPANVVVKDPLRPLRSGKQDNIDTKNCGMTSQVRDIVRALLAAGADSCAADVAENHPLDLALETDSRDLGHFLSTALDNAYSWYSVMSGIDSASFPARMKLQRWNKEYSLLSKTAQTLATTEEEASPLLMLAVVDGDEELIKALLDIGADPLYANEEGTTALHVAVTNGLLTIAKKLIRRVTKLKKALPSNLFHTAARREECNLTMIKRLIELGCDSNATEITIKESRYERKENNLNVIHVLATGDYWWQPVALDYLLGLEANTEATTSRGRTALQLAIRGRIENYGPKGFWRKEAIATLLGHGAKVNFVDDNGTTPLIEAFEEGTDIAKTLIAHGADVHFGTTPPIGHAVMSNNVGVVEVMLQAGADANTVCNEPHTIRRPEPLLLQVARASFCTRGGTSSENRADAERIVELLLDAGADVGVISEDGTPLFIEVIKAHGVISPFLSRGVDMEMRDAKGMTPFLTACAACIPEETLQRMLEAGADPLAKDNEGKTAMHHTIIRSSTYYRHEFKEADLILAKGVPVDALDTTGRTALHYAVEKCPYMSPPVIRWLLEAGANPTVHLPDPSSRSLLHLLLPSLAEGGDYSTPPSEIRPIIKSFVNAGLDKEARDSSGNTPIFGYVARQPDYDDEYYQEERHPVLDEQRRDLLDMGFNLHAKNDAGEGLLHVVAKRSRDVGDMEDTKNMFKLLWELGLNPEEEDGNQRTPLDVAAACRNTGILDLFAPPK
ncbi:MAG: hypothetical protein Q9168_006772 [Polycauliona sp. 1 TL-2023]